MQLSPGPTTRCMVLPVQAAASFLTDAATIAHLVQAVHNNLQHASLYQLGRSLLSSDQPQTTAVPHQGSPLAHLGPPLARLQRAHCAASGIITGTLMYGWLVYVPSQLMYGRIAKACTGWQAEARHLYAMHLLEHVMRSCHNT